MKKYDKSEIEKVLAQKKRMEDTNYSLKIENNKLAQLNEFYVQRIKEIDEKKVE